MEIKLTQAQFDLFKSGEIASDFETLDVNDDNTITTADLSATQDEKIKADIQKLLNVQEEEAELKEFSLDEINALVNNAKNLSETKTVAANTEQKPVELKIDGVQTINIDNIKNETSAQLQSKLNVINNNITLIQKKIEELKAEKQDNEDEKKKLEDEKKEKAATLDEAQDKERQEQDLLDTYITEYDAIQEEMETVNNRIRIQQGLEEERYEKHMEKITKEAIDDFDPAEHGDNFESYFLSKLSKEGYIMFSALTSLNNLAEDLSTQAKGVMANIISQAKLVQQASANVVVAQEALDTVDTKLKDVQAKIDVNNAHLETAETLLQTNLTQKTKITTEMKGRVDGAGMTGNQVLALISNEEKQLVIDNKIDLTKCYVAMGADKKWHIYQANGKSVARQYGAKKGSSLRGADIIANGSGIMYKPKNVSNDTKGARAVYTFTEVNADLTAGEADWKAKTYTTASPLAFDTNGDGVKTSTEKVNFDIDGDGKVDVVNNSADWVLAFDNDNDGKVGEDGSELFGDNTDLDGDGVKDGYKNGFEALKTLAKNEGLISDGDSVLDAKDLKILEEKYGLKMTNGYGGEAKSLADLGITQINIASTDKTTLKKNFDGQNNDLMTQEGATFVVNGQTREYADIWNRKYDGPAKASNLTFNLSSVEPEKGSINYEEIKQNIFRENYMPDSIRKKIKEYKEEQEQE